VSGGLKAPYTVQRVARFLREQSEKCAPTFNPAQAYTRRVSRATVESLRKEHDSKTLFNTLCIWKTTRDWMIARTVDTNYRYDIAFTVDPDKKVVNYVGVLAMSKGGWQAEELRYGAIQPNWFPILDPMRFRMPGFADTAMQVWFEQFGFTVNILPHSYWATLPRCYMMIRAYIPENIEAPEQRTGYHSNRIKTEDFPLLVVVPDALRLTSLSTKRNIGDGVSALIRQRIISTYGLKLKRGMEYRAYVSYACIYSEINPTLQAIPSIDRAMGQGMSPIVVLGGKNIQQFAKTDYLIAPSSDNDNLAAFAEASKD
jgi:hypothetical protein